MRGIGGVCDGLLRIRRIEIGDLRQFFARCRIAHSEPATVTGGDPGPSAIGVASEQIHVFEMQCSVFPSSTRKRQPNEKWAPVVNSRIEDDAMSRDSAPSGNALSLATVRKIGESRLRSVQVVVEAVGSEPVSGSNLSTIGEKYRENRETEDLSGPSITFDVANTGQSIIWSRKINRERYSR